MINISLQKIKSKITKKKGNLFLFVKKKGEKDFKKEKIEFFF